MEFPEGWGVLEKIPSVGGGLDIFWNYTIEATEKFPGDGAFDHLEWTYNDEAFEQLFGLGMGELEQKFSKNSNARGGGGGMVKLRFDWYIM